MRTASVPWNEGTDQQVRIGFGKLHDRVHESPSRNRASTHQGIGINEIGDGISPPEARDCRECRSQELSFGQGAKEVQDGAVINLKRLTGTFAGLFEAKGSLVRMRRTGTMDWPAATFHISQGVGIRRLGSWLF